MESYAFTRAFQLTTFTMVEFEDRSDHLDTYLQAFTSKLNSNQNFTPDNSFVVVTKFIQSLATW